MDLMRKAWLHRHLFLLLLLALLTISCGQAYTQALPKQVIPKLSTPLPSLHVLVQACGMYIGTAVNHAESVQSLSLLALTLPSPISQDSNVDVGKSQA